MTTTGFRSSVNGAVTTRSAAAPEADPAGPIARPEIPSVGPADHLEPGRVDPKEAA
mgnify:CR=1 FL=1